MEKITDFDVICDWVYNKKIANLCSVDVGAKTWYKYKCNNEDIHIKAMLKPVQQKDPQFSFPCDLNGNFVLLIYSEENYDAIELEFTDSCEGENNFFKVSKSNDTFKVTKYTGSIQIQPTHCTHMTLNISKEKNQYYYSFAKSRYVSIRERSWEQLYTLNLFNIYNQEATKFEFENFSKIPLKLHRLFASLWNDNEKSKKKKEEFKKFKNDCNSNDCNSYDNEREKYLSKFQEYLPFKNFLCHFKPKEKRQCSYCGIKESQICNIKPKTKRLSTRGKTLEIDKIDAFKDYTSDNIILACYWCNNAKTDEFTTLEFKEIARGINHAWNQRLKNTGFNETICFAENLTKQETLNCREE